MSDAITLASKRGVVRRKLLLLAAGTSLLTMLLVEVVLHVIDFPYSPDVLLRSHFVDAGGGWLETRPLYTQLETNAHKQRFRKLKQPGVFRLAMLGGSSIRLLGVPQPLKEELERVLGQEVEILNFGMCGCGTDRILVTLREALDLDVEVVLLYAGHNEFISESNRDTYRRSFWLHRRSRLLQLCIGNAWVPEPGRLYTSDEKDAVYSRYANNLRESVQMCRQAGVPIVWGTLAANPTVAPMVYVRGGYEPGALPVEPWQMFQQGVSLFNDRRYQAAKRAFEKAIADSPRPWRATTRINGVLRDLSRDLSVPLADVDQHITLAAKHGIPQHDLFTDYCHLNEQGYLVWMRAYADVLLGGVRR